MQVGQVCVGSNRLTWRLKKLQSESRFRHLGFHFFFNEMVELHSEYCGYIQRIGDSSVSVCHEGFSMFNVFIFYF